MGGVVTECMGVDGFRMREEFALGDGGEDILVFCFLV